MPSGSSYGKVIKSCMVSRPGFIYASSDYAALEARVIANLSKDQASIDVYLKGIDSHSLNALWYYRDQMPDIDPDSVDSINSIKDKYPELRQASKASTFALSYMGTAQTLHSRNGLPMDEALAVEAGYKDLYKGVVEFSEANIRFAEINGYVKCAYGLKVRTPNINSNDPGLKAAEGRTANNAVSQSWGSLMNRAGIEMFKRIRLAGYEDDILILNQVHDSMSFEVRDNPEVIKWLNDNLIESMCKDFLDDQPVQLEAELDIGYSYDKQYTVPNNMPIDYFNELKESNYTPEAIKELNDKYNGGL